MTLRETTDIIKELCALEPNVGYVGVGDVYDLNSNQDVHYPAMVITQQTHFLIVNEQWMRYHFVLFYVDRLTEDKSNENQIQSTAISVLKRIVDELEDIGIFASFDYSFNTFTERFESECSGAYCDINLNVPIDNCDWKTLFDYLKELFQKEIDGKLDKNTFNNYKDITDSRIDKLENQKFKTINGETVLGEGNIEIKGIEYDDSELRGLISGNTSEINTIKEDLTALDSAIEQLSREVENNVTEEEFNAYTAETAQKIAEIEAKGYDDTELRQLISGNTSEINAITEGLNTLDDKLSTLSDKVSQIEEKGYLTKEIADGYYQEKGDYAKKEDIPEPYDDTAIRNEINQIEITIGDIDKILSSI